MNLAKFRMGRILATPNALRSLSPEDIHMAISRHQAGDWGECDKDDSQANERALIDGSRLFSVYHTAKGVRFWIITEASRDSSTVLMPQDY